MQYKVITLSVHSDKLQKVLRAGDLVTDDHFHEGQAPLLVEQGFLIPFDGTNETPVEDPQNPLSVDQPAPGTIEVGEPAPSQPIVEPAPVAATATKGKKK